MQEQRPATPAASDVAHTRPRLARGLGRGMRVRVELRLLQAVLGVGEVSTAVLLVLVEEEFVELVAEVVMVRDILARALEVVGIERLEQALPALLRQRLSALAP